MEKLSFNKNSYEFCITLIYKKTHFQEMIKKEKEGWNIGGMYRYYFKKNYDLTRDKLYNSVIIDCISNEKIIELYKPYLLSLVNYELAEISNLDIVSEKLTKEDFLKKEEAIKIILEKAIENISKLL